MGSHCSDKCDPVGKNKSDNDPQARVRNWKKEISVRSKNGLRELIRDIELALPMRFAHFAVPTRDPFSDVAMSLD
jgi:hypothetical protein